MKYCNYCAQPLEFRIPEGDTLPRHVCRACGTVHYRNPKVVVGCIAEWDGRILLCRRAIPPRAGLWTVPAGFLEMGETAEQGCERETWEEAQAKASISSLYGVWSLPEIGQVYLLYRARLQDAMHGAGAESLECRLFAEDEIPWSTLAFSVIREGLRQYLEDRRSGVFQVRTGVIAARPFDESGSASKS